MSRLQKIVHTWKGWNWNIKIAILSNIFGGIGFSIIYFGTTFLIKAIGGEEIELGTVGFFSIITMTVITLISGIISDIWKREIMIRLSAALTIPGVIILSTANSIETIIFAQILLGTSYGMSGPPMNAIIADSVSQRERVHIFGTLFAFSLIASSLGNLIGWGLLQQLGDQIEVEPMQKLLQFGMVFAIIATILNFMLSDSKCYEENDEQRIPNNSENKAIADSSNQSNTIHNEKKEMYSKITPFIIVISGLLIGFGAGLSIPFLPYFFESYYSLNLSDLFLVFAGIAALTGILGKLLTNITRRTGTIKMIIFTQGTAVLLLVILSTYPPLIWALTIYLVRNAFMNSSGPLVNSILMSSTKKETRARWTAINQLSWGFLNGIAQYAGGHIIETYAYWVAFLSTAGFYTVATIIIPLIKEEKIT